MRKQHRALASSENGAGEARPFGPPLKGAVVSQVEGEPVDIEAGGQDSAGQESRAIERMKAVALEDQVVISPEKLSEAETRSLRLSAAQLRAIEMMVSGATLVASASAAGVTRMTLYRWLKKDAYFQAAYNAWQQDAVIAAKTKLLALANDAVETVAKAVKKDARVALGLLKKMGMLEKPQGGSTDPEEIAERMEIDRMNKEVKLEEEKMSAIVRGASYRGR